MVHEYLLILHTYDATEYLWLRRSHLSPVLPLDLACAYGKVQVTTLKVLTLLVQSDSPAQLIFWTLLSRFLALMVLANNANKLLALAKLDSRI